MKWGLTLLGLLMGVAVLNFPSVKFKNLNSYNDLIQAASNKYGVPYYVIKGVIATESGFNPTARAGTTSAYGLMQMTKAAASDVGVNWENLGNPAIAIDAGTKYLKMQIDRFGLNGGIRAYYAGAGNRIRNSDSDPTNDNPQRAAESLAYLTKVISYGWAIYTTENIGVS